MPTKKQTKRGQPAGGELREEVTVRRLRARLEKASLSAAIKAQKAMLSVYAAADRGRRNKDWRATPISADMAIIPDAATLNARTRQMARDTWVIRSAAAAYPRNVVGCGVIPIPQARDAKGNLLADVNRKAMGLFWEWGGDKKWCDAEEDQTFWQMQALAESERATVGESFWIWSYQPRLLTSGRIDKSKPVGLKIQAFEPEQLAEAVLSWTDPVTNVSREVRGGLELDDVGRVVAYHVYTRNPHDYAWKQALVPVRIPAERVLHYFRKERVRQKRGCTDLAAVLQDARDIGRHKEANLWRSIMEACLGVMVKRDPAGGSAGLLPGMMPRTAGDTGTTGTGMPTIDFVPGMVADPGPGVTLEAFTPQAPGNNYEPFQRQTLRGIAAGAGISYGQLTRDFTQGTYSGQRQEMLEDRKAFEPLQEMFAQNVCLPVYRIFLALCVAEGRIDIPDYESAPMRYGAADYVAPPPTWIDPEKEANAIEKLIELRLMTREEAAHLRGMRLVDILDKIAAEAKEAGQRDITFTENKDDPTAAFKREALQGLIADKATAPLVANVIDIRDLADETGLPTQDYEQPELPVLPPEPAPPTPPVPQDGQPEQAKAIGKLAEAVSALAPAKKTALAQADAPNYRLAAGDAPLTCAACRFFVVGRCQAYDFAASPDHVCDAFEASPPLEGAGGRVLGTPPVPDGERPMDDPRGPYLDRGERGELAAAFESSSTQIDVPDPVRGEILKLIGSIPADDLYTAEARYGAEADPHVTVLYGLKTQSVGPVKAKLADEPKVRVTLGKTGVFADEAKPYDVLYVAVDSPELVRLNKVLAGLAHFNSYPEYVPHLTLAYVKKGLAAKYADDNALAGRTFTADAVTFSAADGQRAKIALNPQ